MLAMAKMSAPQSPLAIMKQKVEILRGNPNGFPLNAALFQGTPFICAAFSPPSVRQGVAKWSEQAKNVVFACSRFHLYNFRYHSNSRKAAQNAAAFPSLL